MGFRMNKTTRFSVQGRGRFPTDMLRYDRCWPDDEKEAEKMLHDGARTVRLASHNTGAPTHARWDSFNWTVVEETI